jgi:SET domain-containing protein
MKLLVVLAVFVALASASTFRGGRIFNGRDAIVGEAPYMIQFRQIRVGETFAQHFCGGKNSMVIENVGVISMNPEFLRRFGESKMDRLRCSLLRVELARPIHIHSDCWSAQLES